MWKPTEASHYATILVNLSYLPMMLYGIWVREIEMVFLFIWGMVLSNTMFYWVHFDIDYVRNGQIKIKKIVLIGICFIVAVSAVLILQLGWFKVPDTIEAKLFNFVFIASTILFLIMTILLTCFSIITALRTMEMIGPKKQS